MPLVPQVHFSYFCGLRSQSATFPGYSRQISVEMYLSHLPGSFEDHNLPTQSLPS